jgi:predicted nucleic acid-binding Zn ribbon protein
MAGSDRADERRTEPQSVGEVIRGVLAAGPLRGGVALGRLARSWGGVVGEQLAGRSSPARLERGVLVVSAESSPWAAQATFLSEEIRRRANEILGSDQVVSVRVVVARGGGSGVLRGPRRPGSDTPR